MPKDYDKESVYDEKIAPLMAQIITICKEEQLPMAAQFYLQDEREDDGRPMYCSTALMFGGDSEGDDQIKFIADAMYYGKQGKPWVMTAMIREEAQ